MRELESLAELPRVDALAVIVNCGTKWVSSLALVSALEHAGMPVLVVDCESADGSREHFAALARRRGLRFHWLAWPLRRHGVTLDRLFAELPADEVLLVDSDVEVPPGLVGAMRAALAADPRAYGAGFLHGPLPMGGDHGLPPGAGAYAERMWIPLVLLRTRAVRAAAATGFATLRRFARAAWTGWLLGALGSRNPPQALARLHRRGAGPAFVEYDTGALLHAALLARGWRFAALPQARWGDVRHFHGATRALHRGGMRRALARFRGAPAATGAAHEAALARLRDGYGIDAATLADGSPR